MSRYVVDASVVVKLFFAEQHSSDAEALIARGGTLLAPDFLFLEIANVFWKRAKRDSLPLEEILSSLRDVSSLAIIPFPTTNLVMSAVQLASQTGRTVYDC